MNRKRMEGHGTKDEALPSLKILFLHGLESGPRGRKARYLQSIFPETLCPDLNMSLFRPDKSNGILRSAVEVWWQDPSLLLRDRQQLITKAGLASLEKCANDAKRILKAENVEVLCGSSWGGAVALWMLARGDWKGNTILIAPAFKRVFTHGLSTEQAERRVEEWYSKVLSTVSGDIRSKVVIIHGEGDDTIPLDDSQQLAERLNFRLVKVPHGDHALNEYLIDNGQLLKFLKRFETLSHL